MSALTFRACGTRQNQKMREGNFEHERLCLDACPRAEHPYQPNWSQICCRWPELITSSPWTSTPHKFRWVFERRGEGRLANLKLVMFFSFWISEMHERGVSLRCVSIQGFFWHCGRQPLRRTRRPAVDTRKHTWVEKLYYCLSRCRWCKKVRQASFFTWYIQKKSVNVEWEVRN